MLFRSLFGLETGPRCSRATHAARMLLPRSLVHRVSSRSFRLEMLDGLYRPTWFAQPLGQAPSWSSPAYSAALTASCASALAAHRLCMPVFCLPAASAACATALTGQVFRSRLVFELPQPVSPCGSTVLGTLGGPKTILTWQSHLPSHPPACAGGWI